MHKQAGIPKVAIGVLWVIVGTGIFSFIFASAKFYGEANVTVDIIFFRYLGGFVTIFLIVLSLRCNPFVSNRSRVSIHIARSMSGVFGGGMMIYAIANMRIIEATAIGLLDAVFAVLLGMALLREKLSKWQTLAILCCIGGAIVIVNGYGAFSAANEFVYAPATMALAAAFFIALEGFFIKLLAERENPIIALFFVNMFGTLIMMPVAYFVSGGQIPVEHLIFLLVGPLALLGQYCFFVGYKLVPLSVAGPTGYSWLIFSAGIGVLFFNEALTFPTIAGSFFIVVGGVALALLPAGEKK